MYEQLRNDLLVAMTGVASEAVATALKALDQVAGRYDITRKETGLMAYNGELPESAKIYLVCKKLAGLSEATLENYRGTLTLFFRTVGRPPEQVTSNDIRMWLYAYQQSRGVSDRTLDKYREYIVRFFSWANDQGYLPNNPGRNVESIKYEERPRQALTQIELEYLRMACKTSRELAIIETLYSTGCRVSELGALKKSDVDWYEKSVHLFGKGKKHRYSFLNAKAEVALRVYLESRTDACEYLFVTSRKPYRSLSKDGIEKIVRVLNDRASLHISKHITPHILRHTTATTALHNGMPVEEISKLLGHESIDTTMIYAESSLEAVRADHKKHIV